MKLLFVTERITIMHLAFLLKGLVHNHKITVLSFDQEDNWLIGKDTKLFESFEKIPFKKKVFLF